MAAAIALNPAEALRRRRIVGTALSTHLGAAGLAQAMEIWQACFAGEQAFQFAAFAKAVSEQVDGAPQAGALLQGMAATLNLKDDKLGPDPMAKAESHGAVGDELAVFNAVLSALVARIDKQLLDELREYMVATVSGSGVAADGLQAVSAWCAGIGATPVTINQPISLADMRAVVHHMYVWCCEGDGPVAADRLFGEVMVIVDRMPQARILNPRKLL